MRTDVQEIMGYAVARLNVLPVTPAVVINQKKSANQKICKISTTTQTMGTPSRRKVNPIQVVFCAPPLAEPSQPLMQHHHSISNSYSKACYK
ncbi:hypothetical protein [Pelotalea chapellei]|uniref:Uncharacterized protein n=1 Tax=Pelotalea chapellei TaxID=44671 RepID=A0ABS5UBV6_9BACT|nr:hypothetical protein [Pelotalea chapellei]MBT1073175.1 hypothetical protein [Pelotalea chapellei]